MQIQIPSPGGHAVFAGCVCRNVHYIPGKTPLVGWLKGFMVPELLDIPVSRWAPNSLSDIAIPYRLLPQIGTVSVPNLFDFQFCIRPRPFSGPFFLTFVYYFYLYKHFHFICSLKETV